VQEQKDGTGRGEAAYRLNILSGIVALLGDVVYEGARSIAGPFLFTLGTTCAAPFINLMQLCAVSVLWVLAQGWRDAAGGAGTGCRP
jgi:hypothetical protein